MSEDPSSPGVRAKVVKKPELLADFYGKVGTIIWRQRAEKLVTLKFDDGQIQTFEEDDLRMDVRASG
jgi:hypothetical protein